jgi:SAM-dependent methyltransferase
MPLLLKGVRLLHEASELLNDSRYSIRTAGHVLQAQAGVTDPDANEYAATPYRVIRRLLRLLPPESFEGSFIDYGCGRGRVAIVASSYGFRRVIGIEISEVLYRDARENIRITSIRSRCNIELMRANAGCFDIPDDATVMYLYKPFGATTTEDVFRRIAESMRRRPREIWILAYNASLLIELACTVLRADLVRRRETIYPTIPWAALRVSPNACASEDSSAFTSDARL